MAVYLVDKCMAVYMACKYVRKLENEQQSIFRHIVDELLCDRNSITNENCQKSTFSEFLNPELQYHSKLKSYNFIQEEDDVSMKPTLQTHNNM